MTTSSSSPSQAMQSVAAAGSLVALSTLAAAVWQYTRSPQTGYLVLAGAAALALAAHILAGWLGSLPGRGAVATAVFSLSLAVVILAPAYFIAEFWILGLMFGLLWVVEAAVCHRPGSFLPAVLGALLAFAGLIAIDLWLAPVQRPRVTVDMPNVAMMIVGVTTLLSLGLIMHEWLTRRRGLRPTLEAQLSLLFSLISSAAILAVLVVVVIQIRASQVSQVGKNFRSVAEFQAERVGNNLEQQFALLKLLWRDQTLTYAINTANTTYGFAAYRPETLDKLRQKDAEWQALPDNSELVKQYTLNPQTQALARFAATNPAHSNLLITDRLGALVAAQGKRPQHFYFGDEAWWQAAWNNGKGALYIGNLAFDPQTGAATVLIALVFKDPSTIGDNSDPEAGQRIGVLASTFDLGQIQNFFDTYAENSTIHLVSPDGVLIASNALQPGATAWPALMSAGIIGSDASAWSFGLDADNQRSVIANSPIRTTAGTSLEAITPLGWQVVVLQPEAVALLPVTRSIESASLVGSLALGLVLVAAALISRRITRPIEGLTSTAVHITQGDLSRRAQPSGPVELYTLAEAFNTLTDRLQQTLIGLEQRVAERTRDLERRSVQIQAAADVGRAATSILDSDELLQHVVELIRERFKLYYVGLFLVETAGEVAVLRAGTGEAGRALLARRHRIKIGEGMVGWCISHSRPRVAMDVKQDAVRLSTDELVLTRSEAAIPMHSRGRVIGAITVQSERPAAFDDETVAVLQTMADQVGVALDNAQLFAESAEALEAARRAYGELSRQAWSKLLRSRPVQGYRCDEAGVVALRETSSSPDDLDTEEVRLPVRVRGQVLGTLRARKRSDAPQWSKEEITLIETLVDQMSVALENARLYSDTQRRAERERLIAEITARVRASASIDSILRTAIQELSEALRVRQASVQLRSGDGGRSDE